MKLFTTLFFSLLFFQLIAQNVKKELYEDGKIKAEGAYTSAKIKNWHLEVLLYKWQSRSRRKL